MSKISDELRKEARGFGRYGRAMMTAPTRDERREVAERLREYGNDALKDGSLLKTLKDVTGADSWRYVLLALADLIDPTCHDLAEKK